MLMEIRTGKLYVRAIPNLFTPEFTKGLISHTSGGKENYIPNRITPKDLIKGNRFERSSAEKLINDPGFQAILASNGGVVPRDLYAKFLAYKYLGRNFRDVTQEADRNRRSWMLYDPDQGKEVRLGTSYGRKNPDTTSLSNKFRITYDPLARRSYFPTRNNRGIYSDKREYINLPSKDNIGVEYTKPPRPSDAFNVLPSPFFTVPDSSINKLSDVARSTQLGKNRVPRAMQSGSHDKQKYRLGDFTDIQDNKTIDMKNYKIILENLKAIAYKNINEEDQDSDPNLDDLSPQDKAKIMGRGKKVARGAKRGESRNIGTKKGAEIAGVPVERITNWQKAGKHPLLGTKHPKNEPVHPPRETIGLRTKLNILRREEEKRANDARVSDLINQARAARTRGNQ